jgi:tRNA threonylcarbamoyladenosine dehydratase
VTTTTTTTTTMMTIAVAITVCLVLPFREVRSFSIVHTSPSPFHVRLNQQSTSALAGRLSINSPSRTVLFDQLHHHNHRVVLEPPYNETTLEEKEDTDHQSMMEFPVLPSSIIDGDFDDDDYNTIDDDDNDVVDDDLDWFRFASIDELYSTPSSSSSSSEEMSNEDGENNDDVLKRLQSSTVAIVGVGGVGTWTAEALCRSGVGHFVLIDLDDVCISQTTSSLSSLSSNVGKFKTDTLRQRLRDIHPTVKVDIINDFVKAGDNVDDIVSKQLVPRHVDIVIDSIDDVDDKTALWTSCQKHGIRSIITTGSPGGRKDPTKIVSLNLEDVDYDQSLIACRDKIDSEVNHDHETHHALIKGVLCVYSEEVPIKASFGGECLGSACFVSGSFGFVAASQAIEKLLQ